MNGRESGVLSARIELEALVTEREAMLAKNRQLMERGKAPEYGGASFLHIANELRSLLDRVRAKGELM